MVFLATAPRPGHRSERSDEHKTFGQLRSHLRPNAEKFPAGREFAIASPISRADALFSFQKRGADAI
jgi:hypothetical protein